MGPISRPTVWVGRRRERAILSAAVDAVGHGSGSAVWIEGEPGMGKSAVAAACLEAARDAGWNVLWGTADQLSQRLPLRVVLDCLQIRAGSPDARRSAIADYLRNWPTGPQAVSGGVYAAAEMLLTLVDELCASSPTVIVVDDLQWADDASLTVWHRLSLAVGQLPLLLVGICQHAAHRAELRELRATLRRRGGTILSLSALSGGEADALVASLVGVAPRGSMATLLAGAMGNPLYLTELVMALGRERILALGSASVGLSPDALPAIPASFAAMLHDRLSFMPDETLEMLRVATLLGHEFAVTDLAVVLRRPVIELMADMRGALAAGILAEVNSLLAFRYPLIHQALYDSVPLPLRMALHRDAAQALAAAKAEPLVVAQQLLAAARLGDPWSRRWIEAATPTLAAQSPDHAVELLALELDGLHPHDKEWEPLTAALARTLGVEPDGEGVARADEAFAAVSGPPSQPEIHWPITRSLRSKESNDQHARTVGLALVQDGELHGGSWARLPASLAMFYRAGTGQPDDIAQRALRAREEGTDSVATASALVSLWSIHAARNDHIAALDSIDRALHALGDGVDHMDLQILALDCRLFTLQSLDRWSEAEQALRHARDLAQRNDLGSEIPSLTAAVLLYWLGHWDDALAELTVVNEAEITFFGHPGRGPALLSHGAAALMAARRDDRQSAARSLSAGLALPVLTAAERESSNFLIVASALVAEQDGDPVRALAILSALLHGRAGDTLVHQWMPEVVRLGLAVEDRPTALVALRACEAKAATDGNSAGATAASDHCAGLFNDDLAALRRAVTWYRSMGPAVDLAGALEDLAVVLSHNGEPGEARIVLNEAVDGYGRFGAVWDIGRAERRLRAVGIRRGVHGPRRQRAAFGWEALTPTELKIVDLIARGHTTPQIAERLFLSRRTVQAHISHILAKLGVHSRVDIAREAFHRGAASANVQAGPPTLV